MEKKEDILELTFSGSSIKPDSLKASELAELIVAYENSIMSVVARDNKEINQEEAFISLVEVQEASAHFKFKPKAKGVIFAAALAINAALNSNSLESLPYKSVDSLQKIWNFTKRRNCTAEFTGNNLPTAKVTPEVEIRINDEFFHKGETTLYGVIERVGGAVPKVRVKLDDGAIIYVEVNQVVAKELAHRLYETVGIKGLATWRKEDFTVEDFKIDEVLPFNDTQNADAVHDLKDTVGKYWDDINDPESFLQELRYTG